MATGTPLCTRRNLPRRRASSISGTTLEPSAWMITVWPSLESQWQRRFRPGDGYCLPQPLAAELLLRPDERVQPGNVGGIAEIEGIQVDAGAPHHPGKLRGHGHGAGGGAAQDGICAGLRPGGGQSGHRSSSPAGSVRGGPEFVAVAVREQGEPRGGADFDQRQRTPLRRSDDRQRRQQRGAATCFVGLGGAGENRAGNGVPVRIQETPVVPVGSAPGPEVAGGGKHQQRLALVVWPLVDAPDQRGITGAGPPPGAGFPGSTFRPCRYPARRGTPPRSGSRGCRPRRLQPC